MCALFVNSKKINKGIVPDFLIIRNKKVCPCMNVVMAKDDDDDEQRDSRLVIIIRLEQTWSRPLGATEQNTSEPWTSKSRNYFAEETPCISSCPRLSLVFSATVGVIYKSGR
jgi:hypothetical protein